MITVESVTKRYGDYTAVRFTAQCSTTFQWLSPVLRAFREQHPEAEVRIQSVPRDEPIPALLDNIIDVALITKPDRQMDRVALTPVFADDTSAAFATAGRTGAARPWWGFGVVRVEGGRVGGRQQPGRHHRRGQGERGAPDLLPPERRHPGDVRGRHAGPVERDEPAPGRGRCSESHRRR